MPNKWNKGDVLKLIADCELGKHGDVLRVTSTAGPYMTATVQHRTIDNSTLTEEVVHTGRDYAYAVKIGTSDPDDDPVFSWIGDALTACDTKLREVERRAREVPTARRCADRLALVCAELEEIADEFANADHTGGA